MFFHPYLSLHSRLDTDMFTVLNKKYGFIRFEISQTVLIKLYSTNLLHTWFIRHTRRVACALSVTFVFRPGLTLGHLFTPWFMYGCYCHFNNLRFNISQHINGCSAAHVVSLFASSEILKGSLLKWLLDHPMTGCDGFPLHAMHLRPISLLTLSLLTFPDSNFSGNSLWA